MKNRNVELTEELNGFVDSLVQRGLYADGSEVIRCALRMLEKEHQEHEEKMALLHAAISEGDASADAEEGVFDRLYAYIDELAVKKAENVA
jgi:putative addiction module CopG family antidote